MIQNTVGLFGAVAGFGMGLMATRYVAELRSKDPIRAGRIIALSSITTGVTSGLLSIALFVCAPWLAARTMAAPQLGPLLRFSSVLLLLSGINSAQTGALAGFEAFKTISKIGLYSGLLSFPITALGALHFGVRGALCGLVMGAAINCSFNWFALRYEARKADIPMCYAGCLQESSLFWQFNLPVVLNSISFSFLAWGGGALLAQRAGGYCDLGVYNAVLRVKTLPESLSGTILAPLLPVLCDAFGRRDDKGYFQTLSFAFAAYALICIPPALLQLAAPWLTLMPFGQDYAGGESVVRWLMLGAILFGLITPISNILISTGQMWLAQVVGLSYVLLYLGLSWWLIPIYGAAGLSCAGCCAMAIANVPLAILIFRKFLKPLWAGRWLHVIGATLLAGFLAVCVSKSVGPLMSFAAGTLVSLVFTGWLLMLYRGTFKATVVAPSLP